MTVLCPALTFESPLIVPGFCGRALIIMVFEAEAPLLHAFDPLTVIFPDVAFVPKLTLILFVALEPVAPGGKVQI